jgi:hypothetical protein
MRQEGEGGEWRYLHRSSRGLDAGAVRLGMGGTTKVVAAGGSSRAAVVRATKERARGHGDDLGQSAGTAG